MRRLRRETSAQTAENFLRLRRSRRSKWHRQNICCPRFAWGDGTHEPSCEKFEGEK